MFPVRIETARLLLRELEEEDAAAANAYESRADVVRYTSHGPRTMEESLDSIRESRARAREEARSAYDLAIVERASGRMVGRCGFGIGGARGQVGDAAIWYILHPSAQGRGVVGEAMQALLGFGFGAMGLHRVYADIDPRNVPSVKVCERLGMRREAHHVENFRCKGEWADSLIYALLAREWRGR